MAVDKEVISKLMPWLANSFQGQEFSADDMIEYIVSIVTAPGTMEELYNKLIEELQEFMGASTKPFVDSLFAQINALSVPQNADPLAEVPQTSATVDTQATAPQTVDQQQGQSAFRRNFRSEPAFDPQAPIFQPKMDQNQMMQQFQQMQAAFPNGFPNGFPNSFPNSFGQGRGQRNPRGGANRRFERSNISSTQNEMSIANRTLVVEKIPSENLNESDIQSYFSRFGPIKQAKLDPEHNLAEVEFEAHDDAVEAHKCPEPIFGNRFVKVFWRRKPQSNEDQPEPEIDIEAARRMQAVKQAQFEEKENKRKELSANLKAAMAEQANVLQQRQEMLQAGRGTPEEHAEAQRVSESLMGHIQDLKKELNALNGGVSSANSSGRGGRGGYNPYLRGRGRGRGGYRGGRGGFHPGATLDRRPKAVQLRVGPENDEKIRELLVSRNTKDVSRKNNETVIIDFEDRRSAEEFYNFSSNVPELSEADKQFVRMEDS